jgi:hypothetical protein
MITIRSLTLGALLTLGPITGLAQDAAPAPAPASQPVAAPYTTAQLDQMLAPIALYPDTLLSEILMAATYPVQIVEAERWLADPANSALNGDALVAALQPMSWDPSVKSLVPFPQILKQLNDQLDWTQSLGTAFVNQQSEVMAEAQVLRHRSEASGKLVTTAQLDVRHDGAAIVIEPANPAVVYVPVYNPVEVYGPWAYPAYPPYYFPPYPGFFVGPVGIGIGFSVGFGVVGPLWGWGHPSWGAGNIFIDSGRFSRISFNHVGSAGSFQHAGAVGRVGAAGFHGPGTGMTHAAAAHSFGGGRNAAASHGVRAGTAHASSMGRASHVSAQRHSAVSHASHASRGGSRGSNHGGGGHRR